MILDLQIAVDYDFNDVTIRKLISLLANNQKKESLHHEPKLYIEFGTSLRLLSLQDILLLLESCKERNVFVLDLHRIDWHEAVLNSKKGNQDPTKIEHARDSQGYPYLTKVAMLQLEPKLNFVVMQQLIQEPFDLNLKDTKNGETVIFSLIRNFDLQTLKHLFGVVKYEKKIEIFVNYYNKHGQSPLLVALELYKEEKERLKKEKKEKKESQKQKQKRKQPKELALTERNIQRMNAKTQMALKSGFVLC